MSADPMQVLDVLADVLRGHMNADDALPDYRVARVIRVAGDEAPGVLLITMRNGDQYRLTLDFGVPPAAPQAIEDEPYERGTP
jgi:hypothetical protein